MLLNRTISQLAIGHVPQEQADAMGHLGYMQWLGALNGNASYSAQAKQAYARAQPFIHTCPAVAVFCELLLRSTRTPLTPLKLKLPQKRRRGGAKARRGAL
ncbi:MAG: hypothetical protein AAGM84_11410 [Pseudomonadota bacterium]